LLRPIIIYTYITAIWFVDKNGTAYLFIGFDIRHNKFDYNDQQQEKMVLSNQGLFLASSKKAF
jgi:hypothetical protein